MTLLDTHLEQISLCAAAISELSLSFQPTRIFTNALLHPHDITALIRDTEAHERALFTVPPPPPPPSARDPTASATRRNTVFSVNGNGDTIGGGGSNAVRAPRRNTAVSAILGGEVVEQIRRGGGGGVGTGMGYTVTESRDRGEVDVDVLLKGAEKLCGVYTIPGIPGKISNLRSRHAQLSSSIAHYEARVSKQAIQLEKLNRPRHFGDVEEEEDDVLMSAAAREDMAVTEKDLSEEQDEILELERKKRDLEDRVSGMERDLGGLLR